MDKIIIQGGKPLNGIVKISGAKNSALPIMAAGLLAEGTSVLKNIPDLLDIRTLIKLLEGFGAKVQFNQDQITLNAHHITNTEAPYELVKTMRASVVVLGPLLARMGKARVSLPGGCAIGARPIDRHLKAFEAMGAEIKVEAGYVEATAKKLHGATIIFDDITVTGTENVMMAAVLAEGTTIIHNAAREPEVTDLAEYLIKMGAQITGAGTDTITIQGVERLQGAPHSVIPDRIEAGTYMMAFAMTGGTGQVTHVVPEHFASLTAKMREAGIEITESETEVFVKGPQKIKSVDVVTHPYPGFATDFQAQFMAMMAIADGTSTISENIFENRFMHVGEMLRMGADIRIEGKLAVVKGVSHLSGAPVMATDLRASASLILAGLVAEGETEISRVYHLDRGYEVLEKKLSQLGAQIWRV